MRSLLRRLPNFLLRNLRALLQEKTPAILAGHGLERKITIKDKTFHICLGEKAHNMAYIIPPHGAYEPWVQKFLHIVAEFIGDDKSAIDAGANMGILSLTMAVLLPKGKVIAFEPVPTMYKHLVKNMERNSVSNVIAEQVALTATDTEDLHINISRGLEAGGSFISMPGKRPRVRGTYSLSINSQSLDSYLKQYDSNLDIKLLKLDIEGWESAALRGARETLAEHDPITFLEFNITERNATAERRGSELYAQAASLFKHIYLINRFDQKLYHIPSYAGLRALILTGHFVEDLLCFNDPNLKIHLKDEIEPAKFSTYGAAWTIPGRNFAVCLSQYADHWCNGHDFAFLAQSGKYRLTLRNVGPHARNRVFLVHGNELQEHVLGNTPLIAEFSLNNEQDNIIYIFAEKTFPAREFFRNDDPRELGIQVEVSEI